MTPEYCQKARVDQLGKHDKNTIRGMKREIFLLPDFIVSLGYFQKRSPHERGWDHQF